MPSGLAAGLVQTPARLGEDRRERSAQPGALEQRLVDEVLLQQRQHAGQAGYAPNVDRALFADGLRVFQLQAGKLGELGGAPGELPRLALGDSPLAQRTYR